LTTKLSALLKALPGEIAASVGRRALEVDGTFRAARRALEVEAG